MAFRAASAEDRFGFQTSGRVRIQNTWDKPVIIVFGTVMVIGVVIGVIIIMTVLFTGDLMALATFGVISFVCLFVTATLISFVMTGEEWKYDANEKQFNLHIPKKPDVIFFYEDVEEVRFTPTRLLRHERGYKVLIRTKYRDFTYGYIFTKNRVDRSPQGSPFFIIAERAGLIRGDDMGNSIIFIRRTE